MSSCIEPPLNLPAEEVLTEFEVTLTDLEVLWNVETDWQAEWYYGWNDEDIDRWGKVEYPEPDNFEVRRFYTFDTPRGQYTQDNKDGFTIQGKRFRRVFQFGYYDMLLWSNIDAPDGVQAVTINEEYLSETTAGITKNRTVNLKVEEDDPGKTDLYNQPEVFYSTYPRGIYISRDVNDYDYFSEEEQVWVKRINCTLDPLVYIYLVQVIIYNNESGRVRDVSGEGAITGQALKTSVNTGNTSTDDCVLHLTTNMKKGLDVNGRQTDIIGTRINTYGLCGMQGLSQLTRSQYQGTCPDNINHYYVELKMSSGGYKTLRFDISQEMQKRSRGGVITIEIDADKIVDPGPEEGEGTLFDPVVEDYDEEEEDIPL